MQHIKITFRVAGASESELLIASLAEAGYDGFEETETELLAYIEEEKFDNDTLKHIAEGYSAVYSMERMEPQNWNAVWEANFEPVIVKDFCTILADFHRIEVHTPYRISITPKMSFGTGHHATTQQMMLLMKDVVFAGKKVLDFGTGTGVLAILAELLGAAQVLAIDNDEWAVENARENVERNGCNKITVRQGSLESVADGQYDVILANINRNILLNYMSDLYRLMPGGGQLLMSGLLREDGEIINNAAEGQGLKCVRNTEQNNWIALLFNK